MSQNRIMTAALLLLALASKATSQQPSGIKVLALDSAVLKRSHEYTVIQSLAGRIPNVLTHQQGGEPGASTAFRVRGPRTIVGGQPTFVLDGIPISNTTRITGTSVLQGVASPSRIADLSPDDIASIEVLSSAAATSLYGSAVGNGGAILITTKTGSEEPTAYSFRSTIEVEKAARIVPLQRRYGLGVRGVSSRCVEPDCFLATNFFSWGPELPPGTPTYDHAAEVFNAGRQLDQALAVAGRSGLTSFRFSATGLQHDGVIVGSNDDFQRYTLRLGVAHRARSNLTIRASGAYARTDGSFINRGNSVNSMLLGALRTPPEFDNRLYLDPTTRLHKSFRFPNPSASAITQNRGFDNPFYVINEASNTSASNRLFAHLAIRWEPIRGAAVGYVGGLDRVDERRTAAFPISSSGVVAGGQVEKLDASDRITDHRLSLGMPWTLSPALAGNVTIGVALNRTNSREHDLVGRSLRSAAPLRLSNTRSVLAQPDSSQERTISALFIQSSVDIGHELTLDASVRAERNSVFRDGRERAWLPAASVSWDFMRGLGLRAAFGENVQEPPWSLQHRELAAERVCEIEVGADVILPAGLAVGVTYYSSLARNVIVPLASTADGVIQARNTAPIRNRGWELTIAAEPVSLRGITVDIGLQWARNRNVVLDLIAPSDIEAPYSESLAGGTTSVVKGHPLGVFLGRDFARCGRGLRRLNNENVQAACAGAPTGALYIGTNGFPLEDPVDRVIGDPNPRWTGGLDVELKYKRLSASALLEHRHGGVTQNMTRASLYQYGTHADTEIRGQKRRFGRDFLRGPVVGPGAGVAVTIDEVWFTTLGGLAGPRAQFMEDATHTRLRSLSLGYSVRHPWVRPVGVRQIDATIYARNLMLWGRYRGFDPETNLGGAAAANRGIDWFTGPLTRAWGLSVALHR